MERDKRLGAYYEYDLSKMVNSKGGFLVEDGTEVDAELVRKEKELEKQRARQNLEPGMHAQPQSFNFSTNWILKLFRLIPVKIQGVRNATPLTSTIRTTRSSRVVYVNAVKTSFQKSIASSRSLNAKRYGSSSVLQTDSHV